MIPARPQVQEIQKENTMTRNEFQKLQNINVYKKDRVMIDERKIDDGLGLNLEYIYVLFNVILYYDCCLF